MKFQISTLHLFYVTDFYKFVVELNLNFKNVVDVCLVGVIVMCSFIKILGK